jgi:phage-related protein
MAAQYSFTMSISDLNEILGTLPGPGRQDSYEIRADRGLNRQVTYSLLTAKFGDGYEQRALDGINTKQESISISFNNRDYKEANLIAAFFDLKQGLNFDLKVTNTLLDPEQTTVDGTPETIRVVCDNYNLVYGHDTVVSIQATLRRVYEPL